MSSLIIYFSRSGSNWVEDGVKNIEIGNTELLAEFIQQNTNGDIFKIETDKKYPDNYYDCVKEAENEIQNNIFPKALKYPENIDKYDTIYIGHPIWHDNLPNVVIGFLNNIDLTGKTIIPFCTHEGSGIAKSSNTLKEIYNNSNIKPYFEIRGYMCQNLKYGNVKNKVENWLNLY